MEHIKNVKNYSLFLPLAVLSLLVLTGAEYEYDDMQPTECISGLTADCQAGYAEVNDITMYYEVHGQGKPLLLIHGGTTFIESFAHQIPVLAEHFRVIAPDSRGHGRTTDADQPLSFRLMADDMIALLDVLDIDQAHVVGMSDGAIIGLELAMRHPERIDRLVAIGANYSPEGLQDDMAKHIAQATADTWFPKIAAFYKQHAPDPSHWPVFFKKMKTMWMSQPNYTLQDLAQIQVPTLVMTGENEKFIKPTHTQKLYESLPNARLKLIPGTGHLAHSEKPEAVNAAILLFLQDESR